MADFETFLEKNRAENEEAVKAAQEALNKAKEKSAAMKAFQSKLSGNKAELIRNRIEELKFECFKKKTLTES